MSTILNWDSMVTVSSDVIDLQQQVLNRAGEVFFLPYVLTLLVPWFECPASPKIFSSLPHYLPASFSLAVSTSHLASLPLSTLIFVIALMRQLPLLGSRMISYCWVTSILRILTGTLLTQHLPLHTRNVWST